MMLARFAWLFVIALAACGPTARGAGGVDANGGGGDGGGGGGGGSGADFTVYAHSDSVLYSIDLTTKSLVTVGNFNAPPASGGTSPDVITDLAVAPSGTIYVISETALYTASPSDGHVTKVGSLSTCGQRGVALTTTPDGKLWVGDFKGAICQIDISGATPVVKSPVMMQNGYALSGDFVAVDNGTVFGSAYKLADQTTQQNNVLVTVNVTTGAVTELGATGFPELFGVAFANNEVFGFTHDGTGRVVTMDTSTGVGTLYATFTDPNTSKGISFAGAGVNSLVIIGRTAP